MVTELQEILEKPKPLSTEQRKAVVSKAKYLQIVAGAGSGKTETMTRKILYYLIIESCDPKTIVAFTFTEKAAESIKSRVHQRLIDLKRDDLLRKFGQIYIGTIHGFCSRLLEDHDRYSDFSTFDENQEMAFLLKEGYGIGLGKEELNVYGGYSRKCDAFVDTLNVVYGELIDRAVLEKKAEHLLAMIKRYEDLLDANRRLTFNLLIYKIVNEISSDPKRVNFIKYLIVDEFQDINKAQYELIKIIGKYASVSIVGDPRQSIYQWRGGDATFFSQFCKDFKDVEKIQISENRRSAKNIVSVSNLISDSLEDMRFEKMLPKRTDKGRVIKINFKDENEEAELLTQKIIELVKTEKVNYSDIALLYRSIKTSASPIIKAFKEEKIPYLVGGAIGLFKRDETQAVGRLIVWLSEKGFWQANHYDPSDREEGDILLKNAIELWADSVQFRVSSLDIEKRLILWKRNVLTKGISDKYQYKDILYDLFAVLGYKKFDQNDDLDASIMANLGRFSNIIGDFQSTFRLGGYKKDVQKELWELCKFLNNYAISSYEEKQVDERISNNCVNIMTIHQAKGLEWPIVIMPSMIDKRFPSNRKTDPSKRWMIPLELFNYNRYLGNEGDEKRLFYVATTRAINILLLSSFNNYHESGRTSKESRFFEIINNNCDILTNHKNLDITKAEVDSRGQEDHLDAFPVKEIIDYEICPFHYRLSKKWGYVQKVGTLEGYGAALHSSLKHISRLVKEGKDIKNSVNEAVDKTFFLPYATSAINNKKKGQVKNILGKFVKQHIKDIKNVRETETRIEFPTENATITGRVDVILNTENPDKIEVRDYKTSEKVIKKEHSELQVRLYSEGLKSFDLDVVKGSVSEIDENKTNPVNVSQTAINTSLDEAKSIIENIKDGKFEARPTKFCKDCEYRTICKWALK